MHDFIDHKLSISFTNTWHTVGETSRYPLRNAQDFAIPPFRIELIKDFPLWSIPKYWNDFTCLDGLKDIPSKTLFSIRLKKAMLGKLSASCTIVDCYICNRT